MVTKKIGWFDATIVHIFHEHKLKLYFSELGNIYFTVTPNKNFRDCLRKYIADTVEVLHSFG